MVSVSEETGLQWSCYGQCSDGDRPPLELYGQCF